VARGHFPRPEAIAETSKRIFFGREGNFDGPNPTFREREGTFHEPEGIFRERRGTFFGLVGSCPWREATFSDAKAISVGAEGISRFAVAILREWQAYRRS